MTYILWKAFKNFILVFWESTCPFQVGLEWEKRAWGEQTLKAADSPAVLKHAAICRYRLAQLLFGCTISGGEMVPAGAHNLVTPARDRQAERKEWDSSVLEPDW